MDKNQGYWDRLAEHYDELFRDSYSQFEDEHVFERLKQLGLSGDSSVLEIGCGTGLGCSMSKRLGVTNYLGIDSSNAMVAMARRNHPGYSFQQLGADELSSIERKFDHIIAINGVCSYIEDVDTFLEDVARLSKSRKGILLGFLNRRSLRRLIQLKTARTEALHCRGGPSCEEGNVQVLYYAGELLKMGQAAGFLNIEVSSYGLFGGLWQNSFATRLEKAVPILGRTFGHSIVFSIQS